jgi:hypothetical protein
MQDVRFIQGFVYAGFLVYSGFCLCRISSLFRVLSMQDFWFIQGFIYAGFPVYSGFSLDRISGLFRVQFRQVSLYYII